MTTQIKNLTLLLIFIVGVMLFNGCYYDVEEDLYPGAVCDTTNITYSLSVKPIINENCISCHSQAVQQGTVILETYADVLVYVNSGQLIGAITHAPGFAAMPQGAAKLDDCSILKIETWIGAGSPDN